MTKYEIKRDDFEFRFGTHKGTIPSMTAQEVFDEYLSGSANDPEIVESFDSEDEAREALKAHTGRTWAEHGNVFWLLRGEVYFIEVSTYDEDGEFDQGGDILDIAAEGYDAV